MIKNIIISLSILLNIFLLLFISRPTSHGADNESLDDNSESVEIIRIGSSYSNAETLLRQCNWSPIGSSVQMKIPNEVKYWESRDMTCIRFVYRNDSILSIGAGEFGFGYNKFNDVHELDSIGIALN